MITNEFRWIEKGESDNKSLYVEDAPTFTLSLASGEQRTVTFVNEKYFLEIKDRSIVLIYRTNVLFFNLRLRNSPNGASIAK